MAAGVQQVTALLGAKPLKRRAACSCLPAHSEGRFLSEYLQLRSESLIYATNIQLGELVLTGILTSIEVLNRLANCEGINGRQPHNLSTLLLLVAPTMSAHRKAGATGSVRHKPIRCNSRIDQVEKHLTAQQKFATSADLSAKTNASHGPAAKRFRASGIQ
jgi:hypothetical protein